MVISESLRDQRFRRAEEFAGKVSVRMMIPLLVFVLPAVMIILLAPLLITSPLMGK
jgi:pilus assembly protein TadC